MGEFCQIAQVTASLLCYYDEFVLFKLIKCDRNTGYLFYRVKQLTQLNRIVALKDLADTLGSLAKLE
ncbi:MAG: MerR family transcriptional regulator [Pleurocapsa sp.]